MRERANRTAGSRLLRGICRSWLLCAVVCMGMAFWCPALRAQEAAQTAATEPTPQESVAPQNSAPAGAEREVSWRGLPRNFLQDQKDIWLFPVLLGKGRHWVPTIAVTGVKIGRASCRERV